MKKITKFQLNVSKIMPARPIKQGGMGGGNNTIVPSDVVQGQNNDFRICGVCVQNECLYILLFVFIDSC